MTRSTILPPIPPVTFIDPAQHPEAGPVRAWQTHLGANLLATDPLFRFFANPRPVRERHA